MVVGSDVIAVGALGVMVVLPGSWGARGMGWVEAARGGEERGAVWQREKESKEREDRIAIWLALFIVFFLLFYFFYHYFFCCCLHVFILVFIGSCFFRSPH